MRRTVYARLVRRGGVPVNATHGVEAGYALRTQLKNSAPPCNGASVGCVQHRRPLDFGLRLDACYASTRRDQIEARDEEVGAEIWVAHTWESAGFHSASG